MQFSIRALVRGIVIAPVMLGIVGCEIAPKAPGPEGTGGYVVDYGDCKTYVNNDVRTGVAMPEQYGGLPFHRGVDIEYRKGVPVRAAADGIVRHIEAYSGGGIFMLISHGSLTTMYDHLISIPVKVGDRVKRSQVIATTPYMDPPPRMHFELRRSRVAYNDSRSWVNLHKYWYRGDDTADHWYVKVPHYDSSIEYSRHDLTFPIDCAEISRGKSCSSNKDCGSGEGCAKWRGPSKGVCVRKE